MGERMTDEGQRLLQGRAAVGEAALRTCPDGDVDRETAASDVIADVLTALYGAPSGHRDGPEADLLDRALRSYWGDHEDYAPEGGDDGQDA
jgi:hypothetical protein